MNQQLRQRNRPDDATFIEPSGGILTEQLVSKLRGESCSESAVQPSTFGIGSVGAPTSETELEEQISAAWEELVERWDEISRDNAVFSMNVSEARSKWIRRLFEELGFSPEHHQADMTADGVTAKVDYLGWTPKDAVHADADVPATSPPLLHMVQPDPERPLDDGDHHGSNRKSPHDELQTFLNASTDLQWSIVTDGLKLRLLRDYFHTYTRGYVEFDLENIFTNRNYEDFRAIYRLCHASRFIVDGDGDDATSPLESLYQVALATGVKVGENLQSNVVEALEVLGNGFLTPEIRTALEEGGQDVADEYYQGLLRVVYRLLFLLFAEQRGMMTDRGDLYTEEYSISTLRERSERASGRDTQVDLWEGLQVTFRLVGQGRDDGVLSVPGYNGGLFDDSKMAYIDDAVCPNHALLDAIHKLTHVEQQGYQQRISYADLGVDEIGAVYESLLEFTPQYAETAVEIEERKVSSRTFYLDDRGMERKETGSYYTKPELVDELIQSALKPTVDDRVDEDASVEEQEEALLSIDVVDPACGSGAFLIAANNYLGKRLAKIRSGSDYPEKKVVREARRSVVQHCLYGVDLNPMAVELAKVSLWINSAVKDQPLSFLDHRIKQGNSLIGATRDLIADGVPADAYETSKGRDWHIGNDLRKRVREENKTFTDKSQAQMTLTMGYDEQEHLEIAKRLEGLDEHAISDVERKAELYEQFEESQALKTERLAHDVWTAAFYWPLDGSVAENPTPSAIQKVRTEGPHDLEKPESDIEEMCALAREFSETHSFFHWELEFPLVYQKGGFDCVLANPPWERLRFEPAKFFAVSRPDIANTSTASKRNAMIEELEEEDPELYEEYLTVSEGLEKTTSFIRSSGKYELTGQGNVNTYAVFSELALQNTSPRGYNGLIVPTGIATDASTQEYFQKIVEEQQLKSLFDFENSKGIFPAVHRSYKFCLLAQTGKDNPQEEFELAFYLTRVEQLHNDDDNRFKLTRNDIERINPNTKNCPTFESAKDAELILKIHDSIGAFVVENDDAGNPWEANIHRMFHMSDDSGLFESYADLRGRDFNRTAQRLECGEENLIGLYESKQTHQYNHRFSTFETSPKDEMDKGDASRIEKEELDNPHKLATPRYWIPYDEYAAKSGQDWHVVLREIARATDRRTAIFCILPEAATGNSLNHISGPSADEALLLIAAFNSYTQDFVARQKVGGTHLNNFITRQLPIPDPERFEQIRYNDAPIGDRIKELALQLTYHAVDLEEFAREAGYDSEPFSYTTPNGRPREEVRFELEALMAHVYGVDAADFERLFSTFEQIRDEELDEYGYYRTRDEIKQRFEEMQDDITTTEVIEQ
ncbi:N-6 DNA methylase [Natronococcus sp. A-GB7]|uniref:Eco57I restriction-modification methylase domain-containing protein n=1 Tax=Natronococcus sp. A-GB7 TaxID=3037649 RepID=UPI00241E8C76|nr:N-6 DNA methylase [Natronococcus sp. A-GB7]MDG5821434.1 N-6 DNA methylase [Natronococcus sp. A-GB7]